MLCCGARDDAATKATLGATLGDERDMGNLPLAKSGVPSYADLLTPGDPQQIFKLHEQLGVGSFGTVFRATDVRDKKVVAVKIVPLDTDEQFQSMLNEVRCHSLASGVQGVCTLFGLFEENGWIHWTTMSSRRAWIVLEHASKGTLRDTLNACLGRGFREEARVREYTRRMLTVTQHLNSRGVVFRDMKPDNWLIGEKGLLLSDFGSACVTDTNESFHEDKVVGSPAYIAPESWIGNYSAKVDVWGVGVIAVEMFSGMSPFFFAERCIADLVQSGEDVDNALKALKSEMESHHFTLPKECSDNYSDFVRFLLKPNPTDRPSASDALDHAFMK